MPELSRSPPHKCFLIQTPIVVRRDNYFKKKKKPEQRPPVTLPAVTGASTGTQVLQLHD